MNWNEYGHIDTRILIATGAWWKSKNKFINYSILFYINMSVLPCKYLLIFINVFSIEMLDIKPEVAPSVSVNISPQS